MELLLAGSFTKGTIVTQIEGGANRRGVHLGVIERYLNNVVGHYLNTLFIFL